jgi:nitrite reductase/ring-hydroxylating ferredoxin subunit
MIPIYPDKNTSVKSMDDFLVENHETGDYRLHRSAFTDETLFELEMKHIFEGNWIYLAHESQIPNNNDYYTTHMGRQPIVIARNRQGQLNAFINACSHRGAMLCRYKRGNKATYTCPFHGWTFNNGGKLLKVKDPEGAGYPEGFNKDGSHDLKKVARFESYRGFLFGSLNGDVKPLTEFLGEAAKIIDMIVDQSTEHRRIPSRATGSCKLKTALTATMFPRCTGIMQPLPISASSGKLRRTRYGRWTRVNGANKGVGFMRSTMAISCYGPSGPIRRTGPTFRAGKNLRRERVKQRPTG